MSLWWLEPGWTDACCARCGSKIWPEGDPDWGMCVPCFDGHLQEQEQARQEEERHRLEMEEMERHYREHPHG